jgi:hypothetical protein
MSWHCQATSRSIESGKFISQSTHASNPPTSANLLPGTALLTLIPAENSNLNLEN